MNKLASIIMQLNKNILITLQDIFTAIIITAAITAVVEAGPPLKTQSISRVGVIKEGLVLPSDVVVVKNRIYVVDGGNHRVAVFNRAGKYLFSFGQQGTAKGEFNGPVGIGADEKGKIYVADRGNHRIQVFDKKGNHLRSIAVRLASKPVRPIDVAVTADGSTLFVTGNNSHSVLVFNKEGKLLQNWGQNGTGKGDFRYPATIVITADKRVAVVDVLNTRVQIFEQDGKLAYSIGDWGVLSGQVVRPKGVAVDKNGHFFVSDSYMELVQVFDDGGHFLHVLGENGKPYKMASPAGIALDNEGRLYVAEMLDNKVSIFELGR